MWIYDLIKVYVYSLLILFDVIYIIRIFKMTTDNYKACYVIK